MEQIKKILLLLITFFQGGLSTSYCMEFFENRMDLSLGSDRIDNHSIASSDELYQNFENDLISEFGDDLSISEQVVNHQVNAVSVAIIEGDKIHQYHQYGFRDKGKTLPANENTTFHVASMSKFLAGLAMAEAERQGILDSQKPVKDYADIYSGTTLEKWVSKKFKKDEVDYLDDINVDRLMSHSAGLDMHGIGLTPAGLEKTIKGILLGNFYDWNGVKPMHAPGVVYDYSGGGYTVAEHVLELVTGETYTDWVTQNILNEVGTNDSTLETAHDGMTNLARGCSRGVCVGSVLRTEVKAAGGFIATSYDYAKILRIIMNDGRENKSDLKRVIKKKVIEKVLTASHHIDSSYNSCTSSSDCPQTKTFCVIPSICHEVSFNESCYQNQCVKYLTDSGGWKYGQGVSLSGNIKDDGYHSILEHGGSQTGYKTKFYVDREKQVGIVILVSGDDWKKRGVQRGANTLKAEIFQSFKRNYLD